MTAETTSLSVYDLIRARLATNGGDPALVDESNAELSYADLIGRVDELAERLYAGGAAPEEPVAVLLDRSVDAVVAMLAVLAAGAAYCPLDVSAPDARVTAILRGLGATRVITDDAGARRLPSGTVVLGPAAPAPANTAGAGNRAIPAPDALAYVLYTSGSTGSPKGVAMTHRGLARLIGWQVANGAPGLRTLHYTATSFDVTFQEILSTLATGGCLVVASEQVRRDPAALLDTIVSRRIQRLFLPYVALQMMAVEAGRSGVVPTSLTHVVTAGERLIITPALRELFAAVPHCRLDNHYGPTETHLVTSFTLPPDAATWPALPSIGGPVAGSSCWALDDRLREARAGEVAELYVAGDGLARGYLNDPARTAERFVAHPYAAGERLYRTGDLVTARPDGSYDFVGRADDQLKVRGFRVEPAEVEHALLSHPRVDAAAVGMSEVADGVSVLVGYLQTGTPVSHREISEHLRGLLPPYMIPTRYVTVTSMPRTSSGKVDIRALSLEPSAPAPASGPSLTDTITAIWARVLGHREFDPDDDFFEVGGDSLLATWVVTELGQALGRTVELSLFLDYSTVAELSEALATVPVGPARGARSTQIVTLRPGPSGRSLYLVHPLGGELIGYRELSRAMRAPMRLLGIGWTGAPPERSGELAEIARRHVEQLRTIEPDGPYWLAGWSFGGVLAYEIAQQLIAAGGTVAFLGLLDANPVIDPLTGLPMAETPFLRMLDTVAARLDDPASTEADLLALTSSETWVQLMGAPIAAGTSTTYLRSVLDTARACMGAAMRYRPSPYPGPIHLFQAAAAGRDRRTALAAAIRELCAGQLTITAVPGDHWGFVRGADVEKAASALDAALERTGA